MKKITLTQGKFAIIDDEYFELVSRYKWKCDKGHNLNYARHIYWDKKLKKYKSILMHRLIMKLIDPKIHIDHVDNDGLNNQKSNLRICTVSQNAMNKRKIKQIFTSKFKGVSWSKHAKKWRAQLRIDSILKHLGYFKIEEQAAIAYDQAAKKYFGEFAKFNIIEGVRRF